MRVDLNELISDCDNATVLKAFLKTRAILEKHSKIAVSISGGSDSDIMLDLIEKVRGDQEIHYVWFDTGLEYKATKDHLDYLEEKYGIDIERIRPVKTIVQTCKEYGQPFGSKYISEQTGRLQTHNFDFIDSTFEVLAPQYRGCKSAIECWTNG